MDTFTARRLLGLGADADRTQVDAAFRSLARRHHPDRGGDPSHFRLLLEARATLTRGRPPPLRVVSSPPWWRMLVLSLLSRLLREPPPPPRAR